MKTQNVLNHSRPLCHIFILAALLAALVLLAGFLLYGGLAGPGDGNDVCGDSRLYEEGQVSMLFLAGGVVAYAFGGAAFAADPDARFVVGDVFAIERELGGGGMSRVFLARDAALERDVVVKVLAGLQKLDANLASFGGTKLLWVLPVVGLGWSPSGKKAEGSALTS